MCFKNENLKINLPLNKEAALPGSFGLLVPSNKVILIVKKNPAKINRKQNKTERFKVGNWVYYRQSFFILEV